MKRWLRILIAVVVLAGVVAVVLSIAQRPPPPASGAITLPDGSWVRVLAVTYGTNHLVGPPLSHVAYRAPQFIRTLMVRVFGRSASMRFTTTTTTPKMVLWLDRGISATPFPPGQGYFECVLADTNGFPSGEPVHYAARYPLTVTEFSVFPRRAPNITLNIYHHSPTGTVYQCGSLKFANPQYRRYLQWKPEPLPATKRAGDVEVTLTKLKTGLNGTAEQVISSGAFSENGRNYSAGNVRIRPLTNSKEVWGVASVEVSDATGNRTSAGSSDWGTLKRGSFTFSPALWPDEAAWKLQFEIRRAEGFSDAELITFRDVPLGELDRTNRIGWVTNFNNMVITLDYVVRRSPPTNVSWSPEAISQIHLTTQSPTNTLHLDFVSARTGDGDALAPVLWCSGKSEHFYGFRWIPVEAKTADFTFVVQQSRSVEFLVKPEVGTAPLEIPPR